MPAPSLSQADMRYYFEGTPGVEIDENGFAITTTVQSPEMLATIGSYNDLHAKEIGMPITRYSTDDRDPLAKAAAHLGTSSVAVQQPQPKKSFPILAVAAIGAGLLFLTKRRRR